MLYIVAFSFYSASIGTMGLLLGRMYGKHIYQKIRQDIILCRKNENIRQQFMLMNNDEDDQENYKTNENIILIKNNILEYKNEGYITYL